MACTRSFTEESILHILVSFYKNSLRAVNISIYFIIVLPHDPQMCFIDLIFIPLYLVHI